MNDNLSYILIHSPLVGPLTWQLVAREMAQRQLAVIVPALVEQPHADQPYWQQHVEAAAHDLSQLPPTQKVVLVAHSGAGPLLPGIRQSLAQSVAAYVFVDAGLPRHGLSRIDLMRLQDPAWADQFQQTLLQGERFPAWTDVDLQEIIPNADMRRQLVASLRPRSLAFFTEPISVFSGWPDAPCAYLKFSAPYEWDALQAKQAGWLVREMSAGHFHMLVDPAAVTDAIVAAVQEITR